MSLVATTARHLAQRGRPMVLRRRVGATAAFVEATVQGFLRQFRPEEVAGLIKQGDATVVLAPDIAPIPAPPRPGDSLVVDGRTWTVQGASPRRVGAALAAWDLHVTGG